MPATQWNTIWTFCHSIKCSFWPATITSWWRIRKWFRYHWLTHSIKKDFMHSPRLQHGTQLHLIQLPPHHAVHYKLHPDQCTDTYPSVQQTATHQMALQNAQKIQKMKRKISRWCPWMMNTGLLKKPLKGHFVFMNMVYHMDYAHTHALTWTIKCPSTWTVWT